jgi:hypothetical protein
LTMRSSFGSHWGTKNIEVPRIFPSRGQYE